MAEDRLREELAKEGLTERQIRAGIRYYQRFAKKFDIPVLKAKDMIVKMVRNMREAFLRP